MNQYTKDDRNRPTTSNSRSHPYKLNGQKDPVPTFAASSSLKANSKKPDDQSHEVINVGNKLLVGSVEQVLRWSRVLSFMESTKIIYQVFGIFDHVKTGSHKCEKIFCLYSEQKNKGIVCVFYEIDRKFPSIPKGTLVLCTGHVKGKNKLQIFTIKELLEDNKNSFDRISLVSQWAVNDFLLYKKI